MKMLFSKLNKIQSKYEQEIKSVETSLSKKVAFEFTLLWQESDGWVMVDAEAHNAGLKTLLEIIEKAGHLSYEDYLDNLI